jgi:hypothetical protein
MNIRKEITDVKATEIIDIYIDKVAHAGNPAHQENDYTKKHGFTGAKILLKKDAGNNDPYHFIDTLNREGFIIKDTTAELYEVPISVIEKDYYSQRGSITQEDGKKYLSWTCSSSDDDPSNWIMHLKDAEGKPSGVTLQFGITKDNESKLRTIYFEKEKFNDGQVDAWLSEHLTGQGVITMDITKEDLGKLITDSVSTTLKPIEDRILKLETKKDEPAVPVIDDAKKEADAKKEKESLMADITTTMKSIVPELMKPLTDRLDKLEGSVLPSQTHVGKDIGEEDEDDESDIDIEHDEDHVIRKCNKWKTPTLNRMDFQVVRKDSKKKKLPSNIAAAIAKGIEAGLEGVI